MDPSDITVSITCLAYNHEKFIRDALEGFLMQKTNFRFEILIHDDASTDRTAEIIKEYEARYSDLIFPIYQKENQYEKGNKPGIINRSRARGKYIAVCEGDDYWTYPYKLRDQVDFMESNPDYSMCFHPARVDNMDERPYVSDLFNELQDRDYSGEEILLKWIVPTASVLYKSEFIPVLINVLDNKDFMYGDIILFLTLADLGKIRCINREMSVYRVHSKGVSSKRGVEKNLRFIKHHKAIQQEFGGKYKHLTDPIIAGNYIKVGDKYFTGGNKMKAIINYFRALFYDHSIFLSWLKSKISAKYSKQEEV